MAEGPVGELDMAEWVWTSKDECGRVEFARAACAARALERAEGEGWCEVDEAMEEALELETWLTEEVEPMREKAVRGRRGLGRWRWKNPLVLVLDRASEGVGSKEGVEENDCPPGVVAPVPYSRSGLAGRELGRDPGLLPGREGGLEPGGEVWSRLSVFMSSESIQ